MPASAGVHSSRVTGIAAAQGVPTPPTTLLLSKKQEMTQHATHLCAFEYSISVTLFMHMLTDPSSGKVDTLVSGHDFFMSPRLSPDGSR